ncbi:MAG: hypothetical protein AB8G77_10285 [Rhodothermales bacterium]
MTTQHSAEGEQTHRSKVREWIDRTFSEQTQRQIATWGRRLLLAAIIGYLIYQLADIGWAAVWNDIPTQPWFYIIFVGMYLGLPLAETLIYQLIWGLPAREVFPMMIKKRVFNKEVFNYSGEANLFLWAKKRLNLPGKEILRDIKDNTVISSLTSMLIAFGLLSTFLFTGVLPLEDIIGRLQTGWIIGGAFCLAMLIALAMRFRKSVIALPGRIVRRLFGIHVGRLIFVQVLQVLQWTVVMPDVGLTVWFTLLSAQIVANQIPFMPSKELLVASAAPQLAGALQVSESALLSMLLVVAALDKLVNFILFSYLSARDAARDDAGVVPGEDPQAIHSGRARGDS